MVHRPLSYEELRDRLAALMPEEFAAMPAGMDRAIAEGRRTASPTPSGASPGTPRAASAPSRSESCAPGADAQAI